MDKKMEITIIGYTGITSRIHSFIPSQPKASVVVYLPVSCNNGGEPKGKANGQPSEKEIETGIVSYINA